MPRSIDNFGRSDASGISISKITFAIIGALILLLVVLPILFGSWYTIGQSQRGIILRNGAVVGVAQPGLNWKMPWIDSVEKISTQSHKETWEKLNSYSFDQQPADLKISVNYHVDPARVVDIYTRFGSIEAAVSRLVSPVINRDVKIVFGHFTAANSIGKREDFNNKAQAALIATLGDDGIVIEGLNVENIDFSPEYIKSIEQRMQAEVEVQKLQQNAAREKVQAEITVTIAKAAADSTVAKATAEAASTKLRGEAEASAISARGAALRDNPQVLELTRIERWNGSVPTTMVPGSSVPFVNLGK